MFSIKLIERKHPIRIACPRCASIECRSNNLPNVRLDEIIADAWADRRDGRVARTLKALLGWTFVGIANWLREPWSCDYCRSAFR